MSAIQLVVTCFYHIVPKDLTDWNAMGYEP
jgi:hypothetical protein